MTHKPQVDELFRQIFRDWQADDKRLQSRVAGLRDWMIQVNQLGFPRFGETGDRLKSFRKALLEHFHREDEMIEKLSKSYQSGSPEIASVRRQSTLDHQSLLDRMDRLIERLKMDEPEFASWTAAIGEVDLFFDSLDEHEYQESESMRMLMPRECESAESEPNESCGES